MIMTEHDRGRVLHHLDKARGVLRTGTKGDERTSAGKRRQIIEEINAVAHNVEKLNTRPGKGG